MVRFKTHGGEPRLGNPEGDERFISQSPFRPGTLSLPAAVKFSISLLGPLPVKADLTAAATFAWLPARPHIVQFFPPSRPVDMLN